LKSPFFDDHFGEELHLDIDQFGYRLEDLLFDMGISKSVAEIILQD